MTKVAYVLAASHSGSTLLAMLLGAHRDLCSVGELKVTSQSLGDSLHYRCSCGELIRQCQFWARVSDTMYGRGYPFDITDAKTDYRSIDGKYACRLLRPMHGGRAIEMVRDLALNCTLTWKREQARVQKLHANLAGTITDLTGTQIVVDSSKVAIQLKYMLRNPELDVKVIRLIRDGRGVALTYVDPSNFADASKAEMRGGGTGIVESNGRMSFEQATHEWRRNNTEAEHLLATIAPSRWIEVHYEDLCFNTDETLERIFKFLAVDPSRAVLDFRSVEHHVVGNGMRLDTSSEITLDQRWRSHLSAADLRVFNTIAGEMNRRYGYE